MMETNAVAIDADFFHSVTQLDDGEFFESIMRELDVVPMMHPYVTDVELKFSEKAQKMLSDGRIRRVSYEEFLPEEHDRRIYQENVWQLFEKTNDERMPTGAHRNIYVPGFRLSEKNLGEIMTELMARELRLPIFMSNDKGAKRIAERHFNSAKYTLEVKNLVEVLTMIGQRDNLLKWKQIKAVLDAAKLSKHKEKIWPLWNR